jgi:hypothetical protein
LKSLQNKLGHSNALSLVLRAYSAIRWKNHSLECREKLMELMSLYYNDADESLDSGDSQYRLVPDKSFYAYRAYM